MKAADQRQVVRLAPVSAAVGEATLGAALLPC
jgi:hypothetical protein